MSEKKDFMQALASDVEAKKQGKKEKLDSIDDFVSQKEYPQTVEPVVEETSSWETVPPEPPTKKTPVFIPPVEEKSGPESFAEEELVKVEKPKRTISTPVKVGLGVLAALALFLIYWFLIAAHIVVPDFVGKNVSEVSTWARQQQMDSGVVAMAPAEYSLEYAKDVVIAQSVTPGKKIKKNTPITITISNGPDPDEEIPFPNISFMTMNEINEWKDENQLLKTKVTTQFSSTVPEGEVISYEVRNGSEENFTRGTTLNVTCSKGPAPAGQVTVEDFKGKTYAELEAWAKTKKVTLEKRETFSTSIDTGYVISTDKQPGTAMNEGDTMVVVVSKGRGVSIPNLVGYTEEQLEAWSSGKNNNVVIVKKSIYNAAPEGTVLSQSLAPGSMVEAGEVLELTISLYYPILQTNSQEWIGKDFLELKAWVDEVNSKGASIQAGPYFNGNEDGECPSDSDRAKGLSDTPGAILEIACYYGTSDVNNGCSRPLDLNSRIAYRFVRYDGSCDAKPSISAADRIFLSDVKDLTAIKNKCNALSSKGVNCHYTFNPNDPSLTGNETVNASAPQGAISTYDTNMEVFVNKGDTVTITLLD